MQLLSAGQYRTGMSTSRAVDASVQRQPESDVGGTFCTVIHFWMKPRNQAIEGFTR